MPEVEHTAAVAAPLGAVWDFCKEMDNWAPLLPGYQGHEVLDASDSIWTLKGEVGGLTRTVQFRVHITEWNGPERVSFTLTGVNEPMQGGGVFFAMPASAETLSPAVPVGWFARWRERLVRFLLGRVFRAGAPVTAQPAGPAQSSLTFQLALHAGGAAGPMINALIAPMLGPVAEDFANKVARQVETLRAG